MNILSVSNLSILIIILVFAFFINHDKIRQKRYFFANLISIVGVGLIYYFAEIKHQLTFFDSIKESFVKLLNPYFNMFPAFGEETKLLVVTGLIILILFFVLQVVFRIIFRFIIKKRNPFLSKFSYRKYSFVSLILSIFNCVFVSTVIILSFCYLNSITNYPIGFLNDLLLPFLKEVGIK